MAGSAAFQAARDATLQGLARDATRIEQLAMEAVIQAERALEFKPRDVSGDDADPGPEEKRRRTGRPEKHAPFEFCENEPLKLVPGGGRTAFNT